ncbi:FtsX-like permease family protein [Anaerotignum neopropionicum]|uniref:FtsX-like permease family protein n=1 Tax=Anaerotignum neopropionicum TaxID=36847 RepID=A0A136WFF0_9FIRM|nr:ABC transporter permease [Anaerotignum neopropionicum]KXL53282.1 FtsX-like permease family protein [Anaerotignum neopropionicum]
MIFRIIKNDMRKNPGNNLALLLFMLLSVGLVATVILTISQLFMSISTMYETARPPHFLQMHKGMIDQEELEAFNCAYSNLTYWQAVEMIDVYGDELTIKNLRRFTLEDCRLDIGLVKQNEQYDVLLNEKREPVHLKKGEIGVPVILLEKYPIDIGDTILLESKGVTANFIVASYIYDGQMNSTLCSSTRFLLSDEDFNALRGIVGETEYLLEAYFKDPFMAADYQTAYEQYTPALPQNGQGVTYTIIFLLSAMTDIMMVMILLVISILLILIALFCMKYTILTAMEEELTEIGTMKAIGLPRSAIANLYLGKMRILMAFGVVFGYLLSLISFCYTSGHMNRTFGVQPLSMKGFVLAGIGCFLVYFITIQYCKATLNKLKKISVVDALVRGQGIGREKKIRNVLLRASKIPSTLLLALHEVRVEFQRFTLVLLVMTLVSCIVIIPINIVSTMEADEFITYMGSDVHDVLIEIEPGDDLDHKFEKLEKLLQKESNIRYQYLQRVRVLAINAHGIRESIHIDSGKTAGFGLQYLKGNAPANENEIALSKLEAAQLGKNMGDSLSVYLENQEFLFTISGIYQDVTSGGMTAKATVLFMGATSEQYTFMVDILNSAKKQQLVEGWRYSLGNGYSVEQMDEFISQILGGVVKQIRSAAWAAMGIGVGLTGLVIFLFMKLRLARGASQVARQKAMGVSTKRLRKQELYQILISAGMGIFCGAVIANLFGDYLVSILFAIMGLGIEKIHFFINPVISWVVVPFILLVFAGSFCWISTERINKMNVLCHLND